MTFMGHFIRWQYDLTKPVTDHSGENSGRKEERHRGSLCRLGIHYDEQGEGRGEDTVTATLQTPLVVRWLRLCAPSADPVAGQGTGSCRVQPRSKIPRA